MALSFLPANNSRVTKEKKNWMAIDRTVAPLPASALPSSSTSASLPDSTPSRAPLAPVQGGTAIAVDQENLPEGLEGDMLSRLLELNTEHTRLQMLYEDLYARYSMQKEQLAEASEAIEELGAAVEKRDARIRVLRMTIRRLKGGAGSQQGRQQFPEGSAPGA